MLLRLELLVVLLHFRVSLLVYVTRSCVYLCSSNILNACIPVLVLLLQWYEVKHMTDHCASEGNRMTSHPLQVSMCALFSYVREHYAIILMGN